MKCLNTLLALTVALSFSAAPTMADLYEKQESIIYGQGQVTMDGEVQSRDLWMNAFLPKGAEAPTGAIFMTFGGSYHRGDPTQPYFMEGARTTSMQEYCEMFVEQGYACFNIDYRVAPELPIPTGEGYRVEDLDMASVPELRGQVNLVRGIMGLEPLDFSNPNDAAIVENTVLAAAEDLRAAVAFVRTNAERFNINPEQVVLGGFSAGSITSLNVSHGMKVPVKGTIMLGTAEIGFDIKKTIASAEHANPILMFQGQYDLPATLTGTPILLDHYEKLGVDYDYNWVPGAGHFYPDGAVSLGSDGTRYSVRERMLAFVARVLD